MHAHACSNPEVPINLQVVIKKGDIQFPWSRCYKKLVFKASWLCSFLERHKNALPLQTAPSPVKLSRHEHSKLPTVLVQIAFESQVCMPRRHSLISEKSESVKSSKISFTLRCVYNRCSWFVLFVPCTRLMKRGRKLVHGKIKIRKYVTCCVCVSLSLLAFLSQRKLFKDKFSKINFNLLKDSLEVKTTDRGGCGGGGGGERRSSSKGT